MLGGGTTLTIVFIKSSAAWMSASVAVIVGIVKYLCLKKTVLQTHVWRMSEI